MHTRLVKVAVAAVVVATLTTGCGNTTKDGEGDKSADITAELTDNTFYVWNHETGECKEAYFGEATFEKDSVKNTPEDNRVLWFRGDEESIPTLYTGDSLIYYTTGELEEKMTFERFEDYGYTIGICGMEQLKSGRFKISTDKDKKNTYPNGDTDELVNIKNKSVILDMIGNQYVRASKERDSADSFLTRSGTLLGLSKDNSYEVMIYEGTLEHKYIFKADVLAMGSMEVYESYDYSFTTDGVIEVAIPEWFNSGYYMINGAGVFRYVKGSSYNENTDFNIPNESPDVEIDALDDMGDAGNIKATEPVDPAEEAAEYTDKFSISESGEVTVRVDFEGEGNNEVETSAIIATPLGGNLQMQLTDDGALIRTFTAEEGEYTIKYYDLGGKKTVVSFVAEAIEEAVPDEMTEEEYETDAE